MSSALSAPRRVFISYSWDSPEHVEWVIGLATRLLENGIDVIIDKWNTRLGSDLPAFMERGLTDADRILAVCSATYVSKANGLVGGAGYEKQIMTAQMMNDLNKNRVVPVIRNNTGPALVPTFLSGRRYVDFRDDAHYEDEYAELIHDLYGRTLLPRPALGPSPFVDDGPEATVATPLSAPLPSGSSASLWQPVSAPTVVWRSSIFSRESGSFSSNTFVEVELTPVEAQRVEVRRLGTLKDELASLGRQRGFFSSTQALETDATTTEVWVRIHNDPHWVENGLLVTREGQRGFWFALPRDDMGSMFDPVDLVSMVANGLRLLAEIPIATPPMYAVGIEMGPLGMITKGSVSALGSRSSATSSGFGQEPVRLPVDDGIAAAELAPKADEIAAEIVARLVASFR